MTSRDDETTEDGASAGAARKGMQLQVATTSGPMVLPLPPRGTVVIGRTEAADLRIDDRSISRRHAALHLGDVVEVEDLGSNNGTRVRGAAVAAGARATARPGDVIEFGAVMCTLLGGAPSTPAPKGAPDTGGLVVEDPAMVRLYAMLDRAAQGAIPVLLLGETGVGKEVFAERLHQRSPRRDKAFVKINCAALTDTLLESELFGHEKGAFSGAVVTKAGLIETADGGTLFLDEVGELSATIQAKLLRVLEDRQVRRVGATRATPVDVRIVSATNRDLEAEASAGRYRSDLYFRLNGFSLVIPALRERVREIAPLARRFVAIAAAQSGRAAPALSPSAVALLEGYAWPGNVRELRNMMGRAVLLTSGDVITPEHLPLDKMRPAGGAAGGAVAARESTPGVAAPRTDDLRDALHVVERERIVEALEKCAGNQTRAAELLGISRRALVTKLGQHHLPRPRK